MRFLFYKEINMPYFEEYPFDLSILDDSTRELQLETKTPVLKLEGTGTVTTSPDIASAFLGVVTENKQLSAAQKENSLVMDRVIASIIKLGIDEKDIKTENYSITPEYDFVEGKQVFRGYRVNNNIRITIRDISQVGKVIDTAVANGANAVFNVNFSLLNRAEIYKRALDLAIKDAVQKAKSVENTLKVRVDEIPVEVVELSDTDRTGREGLVTFKAPATATDIKSGELEVTAKIQTVFNYRKL
jgi:uncharacterized protein YggE